MIQIKNRFTGAVIFESATAVNIVDAIHEAIAANVKLDRADLSNQNLSGLNVKGGSFVRSSFEDSSFEDSSFVRSSFVRSSFVRSSFEDSSFVRSSFEDSSFVDSSFEDSSFVDSSFVHSSFVRSSFEDSSFDTIKADIWRVLMFAKSEAPTLLETLKAGKINGSAYEGECACLCGTIANLKHCHYEEIPGLRPDSSSESEQWFLGIQIGDAPENSPIAAMTADWIQEFIDANPVEVQA